MPMPTILPTGQLHPDLFNGPFVKRISSTPAATGEPGVKVTGDAMAERWKAEEKRVNEYWREHRDEAIDLTPQLRGKGTPSTDYYNGKTVVENKGMGFIIETIDPTIYTAEDANKAAASGGATHGFFYRKTDFLFSAAQEYTALGENEVFRYRNINDVNFVRDSGSEGGLREISVYSAFLCRRRIPKNL